MKIFTFSFLRQPINFSKFEYVYQVTGSSLKEINGTYYDSEIIYKDDLGIAKVAYDKDCYRLGYGGGFYDRFLCNTKCKYKYNGNV